ncbi:MAG: biotin/lipoyl-binding protein [Bacteroidetes bacterium]|nr:biotin/lipoyl-binding protein [Bacteroidota bacterium]
MKKFKFTIKGNQYDVDILNIEDNIAEVQVNGNIYTVEVDKNIQQTKTPILVRTPAVPSTDVEKSTQKTSSPSFTKSGGTIKSPLPGAILNVHVKVGDKITMGQRLITLEAMKMENNIDSDKEGKIASIKVKKGDNVMEGDILIVIE